MTNHGLALKLFPYDHAYPQQQQFMHKMIDVINAKKIGIFESPTGTVRMMLLATLTHRYRVKL